MKIKEIDWNGNVGQQAYGTIEGTREELKKLYEALGRIVNGNFNYALVSVDNDESVRVFIK